MAGKKKPTGGLNTWAENQPWQEAWSDLATWKNTDLSGLTWQDPYTNAIINVNNDALQNTQGQLDIQTNNQRDQYNNYASQISQTNQELWQITQDRFTQARDTFTQIDSRIKEYEDLSRQSFDQWLANQVRAQVRSMAEQGIIGNDQMDAVARLEMSKYKATADLKKIDLERDLQQQYTDALKEKQETLDAIYRDQSSNANQKAIYAQQINQAYNNISNSYLLTYDKLQSTYAASATNALAGFAGAESGWFASVLGSDVQAKIANIDASRATQDQGQKLDYLMKWIQAIDANLGTFAIQVLRDEYSKPDFVKRDPRQQVLEIAAKAKQLQDKANAPAPAAPSPWKV